MQSLKELFSGRLAFFLLTSITAFFLSPAASAQSCSASTPLNCAYVTDGSGHDVLSVDRVSGTAATIVSLKNNQGVPVDVRVGGDNRLYIITSSNVYRVNLDGTGFQTVFSGPAPPSGLSGIRFDSSGDGFVNTPSGVWEFASLIQAVGTKASPFPKPARVTTASCSTSGGLAFDAFGDLLITCNSSSLSGSILECSSSQLTSLPCSPTTLPLVTGAITGLAVDATNNIVYSTGNTVNSVACTNAACTSNSGYPVDFTATGQVPAYLEAVPDPTGTTVADTSTFACNSASPSILVSTANSSAQNGTVYTIDNVASASVGSPTACAPAAPAPKLVAALTNTKVPLVGMASPGTVTTLTKPTSAVDFSQFNYGSASLELTNSTVTAPCNLSMTKEQIPISTIAARLAGLNPPVTPLAFPGEQGWVTGFHGAYDQTNCGIDPNSSSRIGVAGFYNGGSPRIVIIPDDTNASVIVDELPFVYPIAPLLGNPGDLFIHNTTVSGGFTTSPATILVANVGFINNAPVSGYVFCGFVSPFVDPPTGKKGENVVNSGQSATFKFQLGSGSCSKLISGAIAQNIVTGFSVARYADANGNFLPALNESTAGKGNSVQPPQFKFSASAHQFIYTLDTTGFCNGSYEATASGDSFAFHTLLFIVVGANCN